MQLHSLFLLNHLLHQLLLHNGNGCRLNNGDGLRLLDGLHLLAALLLIAETVAQADHAADHPVVGVVGLAVEAVVHAVGIKL